MPVPSTGFHSLAHVVPARAFRVWPSLNLILLLPSGPRGPIHLPARERIFKT